MAVDDPFTEEQKQYLQGFIIGNLAKTGAGMPNPAANGPMNGSHRAEEADHPAPSGPEAVHFHAQNRFTSEGKTLVPEELEKRKLHPLDRWDDMERYASTGAFPKGTEIFAWKFHGLFYVAPAQNSFMCRLRFYGGIARANQLRAVAEVAERHGGGYAHVTTRANLQIREIGPESTTAVLTALQDAGIVSRGSGADNIRNVTGSPTAGIDPRELYDVRPLCRELHYYILHHREMYGLPRKFNIAFDGGGTVSALENTNDIGFSAVRVPEGKGVPSGIYFRMSLGGITGHQDFAADTGILLKPEECVPMAAAVVRVFIDNGDRTDRKKARLKYVLDRWGTEKYLEEAQKFLSFTPLRLPREACEPRPPVVKDAHTGVHPQRQEGLSYVGVVLPVGRMTAGQMNGLAAISERHGSGTIRLTVWQNLLLSDIPTDRIPAVRQELEALGLSWTASPIRQGLIACTGNTGCKFSASDTKRHALEIVEYLEGRVPLDRPVNVHLTGCPHSCAQHYIGDIGLLGTKVEAGDDLSEGYHIFVGGGHGAEQSLAREIYRDVPAEDAPGVIEGMLTAYLDHRSDREETFLDFVKHRPTEELLKLFEQQSAAPVPQD